MEKQPFFILGSQRGGTTLLRLILNKHSQVCVPPESHFFIPLLQKFSASALLDKHEQKSAADIVFRHPRFAGWGITKTQLDNIIRSLPEQCRLPEFISVIFEYKLGGKKIWGEKTPEYIDIIPGLLELFPKAAFILLVRDGRDVSASLKERGWQGWTIYQRAKYWQSCVRNMLSLLGSTNKTVLLKYEDLVLNTFENINIVCKFLDIDYENEMMHFYKDYEKHVTELELQTGVHSKLQRPPDKTDVFKWKYNFNENDIWKFESVCYKELEILGYEVLCFKKNSLVHNIRKFGYALNSNLLTGLYHFYHSYFSKKQKQNNRNIRHLMNLRNAVRKQ